jgi:hypothetical protein
VLDLLLLLSTGSIGLLVGALLAEGALLVPYWRSLSTEAFYALHEVYGPRLYRFFAPLTAFAAVSALLAALASLWMRAPGRGPTAAAGALTLMMLGTYGAYFRAANASFAAKSLSPDALARELARWEAWQWRRVGIGVLAFVAALTGLAGHGLGVP